MNVDEHSLGNTSSFFFFFNIGNSYYCPPIDFVMIKLKVKMAGFLKAVK